MRLCLVFFLIKKTALKKLSKIIHLTQAHGSMEAKNLKKVNLLEEKKEKEKKANILEQNKKAERFIRCQHKCGAFGLKKFSTCKSVVES